LRTFFRKDLVGGLLAGRIFRPPVPVEVTTRDGKIASLRGEDIEGDVRVASGPWRIEEGWWRPSPAAREYWDVETSGGRLYRVYQSAVAEEWFMEGRFGW